MHYLLKREGCSSFGTISMLGGGGDINRMPFNESFGGGGGEDLYIGIFLGGDDKLFLFGGGGDFGKPFS